MSTSGVDRTVMGLVTHLAAYGVVPEVWHLDPSNPAVRRLRVEPVTVVGLPARTRASTALIGLPAATQRFVRERRQELDLIHLHSVFIPDNVALAKLAGLPYVLTPHGGYSPEALKGRRRSVKAAWLRIRERSYVNGASLIHAVSPPELEQLRAMFQTDAVIYVPNAVEPLAATIDHEARHGSRKRIVFLGRLAVDHKGLDILLKGYARYLDGQNDAATELIIAGPDFRSGRAHLEALAASLLPRGRVQFVGPLFGQDKDDLLRSATVFVHTSRWEGMPYAVLEALSAGCPVVLTPATNLGDVVEEYRAGTVVEGTAEGVEQGLRRVLGSPATRYQAMRNAAQRLVSERFTWPKVAAKMAAAYRSLLN